MRNLRVVLDADVLVDAQIRDVFLGLAEGDLLDVRWSSALLDELRDLLVDDMGRQPDAAERLCVALRDAFPLGEVIGAGEVPGPGTLPGAGAPTALAVALASDADLVVAHERERYPPDAVLTPLDVEVLAPDDALAAVVEAVGAARVARVVEDLTAVLDVPPADHLKQLRELKQVAPIAAIAISAHLEAPGYPGTLRDYLLGSRPSDARATVSDLINCVGDGDVSGMEALLSAAAKAALGPTARARHQALRANFAGVLHAPGDWRFATTARVVGPDAEIVKLVHTGEAREAEPPEPGPLIDASGAPPGPGERPAGAVRAEEAVAITFGVVLDDGRWLVDDIEMA